MQFPVRQRRLTKFAICCLIFIRCDGSAKKWRTKSWKLARCSRFYHGGVKGAIDLNPIKAYSFKAMHRSSKSFGWQCLMGSNSMCCFPSMLQLTDSSRLKSVPEAWAALSWWGFHDYLRPSEMFYDRLCWELSANMC